ncbi:hypothetical protein PHYBOEH_009815 [Phytophthora boehmeriae]|uniref:Uncharacterized protein n=1 Tax=Phytophthora boehmeriae TaxID=109152 RepID=A0A8T1VR20_9STRA|nr:hypothetical protein PHYBOEH_009815 [Phytophthora boehmeriae]
MLSRLDDVRVFQSSEDVIFNSSSSRHSRFQPVKTQYKSNSRLSAGLYQENEGSSGSEDKEDEQLHPQHPYRMRKRVLHRAQLVSGAVDGRVLLPFRGQDTQHLEFVMLPTGDILPREDCPPGLELPAMAEGQLPHRIEYQREDFDSESDGERWSNAQQKKVPDRFVSSLSSSSPHSSSSFVADGDVSSGEESPEASESEESRDERHGRSTRSKNTRQEGANKRGNGRVRRGIRAGRNGVRNSSKRTSKRTANRGNLRLDGDSEMVENGGKHDLSPRDEDSRQVESPVAFKSRGVDPQRTEVNQVIQVSQAEDTIDWPTPRTRRSPKMKVSHLLADDPVRETKNRAPSHAKNEAKVVDRLELKLQKEKKRVLEKMTQLLEEQSKNQQLHSRVEALEAELAAKDKKADNTAKEAVREQEARSRTLENEWADRVKALEEQLRQKDAYIAQLEQDKVQLKAVLTEVKKAADDLEKERCSNDKETTLNNEIIQQKDNSKTPSVQQQMTPGDDEQANALVFLKKRLLQREDELRQTHVKYVELKELCARQCVREADLQNFINEHRLRGNLIIRKKNDPDAKNVGDNQTHDQDQGDLKVNVIASRDVDPYREEAQLDEMNSNKEFSDNQDDIDDSDGEEDSDNNYNYGNYEDGDEFDYPVRAPKVFVKVGRDGVYEHRSPTNSAVSQKIIADRSRTKRKQQQQQQQRVERVRLTPSPSLAQRYERVPTPPSTTARRKKAAQLQSSQFYPAHSHAGLSECPPGCGSRLSLNRKKSASGTQRARSKRPVATATKGPVGVIRPWM